MHSLTASVHLSKNEEAKEADPTGCPRSRKPLVSSTGRVEVLFSGSGSLENVAMVVVMDRPSLGFAVVIESMGEEPLHDVSILILDVLTKQPSAAPRSFRVVQRNSRSGRYTHVEMSSTYERRWEIPPYVSSAGSPAASQAAARSRRRVSMGASSRATTNDARSGDRGHPCVTPSCIWIRRQLPSHHLWWTVVASS